MSDYFNSNPENVRVGVIADTHGLLRPEALDALSCCDLVIHPGDVGKPHVLESLQDITQLIAIRGNVDRGDWAQSLLETELMNIAGKFIYVIHDLNALDIDPAVAGTRLSSAATRTGRQSSRRMGYCI